MRGIGMCGHRRGFLFAKPLLIGAVLFVLLGLLVMSLWNALLPAIIGVKSIDFWQALGLLVLSRILFGGLGFRPGMFGMARERRRMHERWMQMTPEQREAFIQQRRDGFSHHGHRGWHRRCDDKAGSRSPSTDTPKTPEAE
ncbi:hypothetical protein [Musicola keenii]|uniref:hypothetical protein n=1 Tax=Musicola keenii TaxID=2884250 RepID=UPI00177E2833|nr:hypothetical protein [Musicola keenii]